MLLRKAAVELDTEVSLLISLVKELNHRCTRKLEKGEPLSTVDHGELEKVIEIATQAHNSLESARSKIGELIAEANLD